MTLKKNDNGFTLVEILVAMVVSGLVLSGIYSTYQSQQRSYILQEEIAQVQQNLRAAMYLLTRELRMAGFNPSGNAGAGIVTGEWTNTSLRLTKDDNGDGDVTDSGEDLTYSLYTAGGIQKLGRKNPATNQPVAENIQELWFVFLDANNVETAVLSNIRSVEVTLVARAGRPTTDFVNTFTYSNKSGTKTFGPYNDGYHRRVLSEQVNCRNLGLGS
ncbi:MAG: prepilin-type N-terminal cleavage/methylation domain-containing protein [Desulfobacterales bacterium]|nr:prepilin-type N-terminal cleavage/methylation domain-containing protein [Desulfobacterales bacterium]